VIIGCIYVAELTIMALWRTYYVLENRKRNKAQAAAGISEEERVRLGAINAELGITDRSEFFFTTHLRLVGLES
jgi:ACS family allantoate permease-like MFS transporter